jgi:hypothetical protein
MQQRRRLEQPPVKAACLAWYARDFDESFGDFDDTDGVVAALRRPAVTARIHVTE